MGNRHHYVPRFYLSAFASAPRRIDLFNFARGQVVTGASLRDQCYAHRLYGSDDIEQALAQFEGLAADVFRTVRDQEKVPGAGTLDREKLIAFLGYQLARTTAAQAKAVAFSRLLANVAFKGEPPKDAISTADAAMANMLSVAPAIAKTVTDLSVTLVVAANDEFFITSDDPAVKYNSYCEGISDAGVTGTKCRGLQIFLPISPRLLLYLFDPGVYKLVRDSERFVSATPADVAALNQMQVVNAEENVYFHNSTIAGWLWSVTAIARAKRIEKPRIIRAVEEGNERSELLHEFWPMPQLNLGLSFVAVRSVARAVPLFDRAHQVRTPYKRLDRREGPEGVSRRFEVRSHH